MQAIDELSILDQAVAESITDMGHELQEVLTAILVTDDQCAKAALTAREDRLVLSCNFEEVDELRNNRYYQPPAAASDRAPGLAGELLSPCFS